MLLKIYPDRIISCCLILLFFSKRVIICAPSKRKRVKIHHGRSLNNYVSIWFPLVVKKRIRFICFGWWWIWRKEIPNMGLLGVVGALEGCHLECVHAMCEECETTGEKIHSCCTLSLIHNGTRTHSRVIAGAAQVTDKSPRSLRAPSSSLQALKSVTIKATSCSKWLSYLLNPKTDLWLCKIPV